jgi:hypothetical protein
MGNYISPELYNKYKEQVLAMSLAIQNYKGLKHVREESCLSDVEIAEKLGLSRKDVTEIRLIAMIDLVPADAWLKADEEKQRKCTAFFRKKRTTGFSQ